MITTSSATSFNLSNSIQITAVKDLTAPDLTSAENQLRDLGILLVEQPASQVKPETTLPRLSQGVQPTGPYTTPPVCPLEMHSEPNRDIAMSRTLMRVHRDYDSLMRGRRNRVEASDQPHMDRAVKSEPTDLMDWNVRGTEIRAFEVLHAGLLLVLARLALAALGFQRTAVVVDRLSRPGDSNPDTDRAHVEASKYVISLAAAFIPARIMCLERSLIHYYKLKRTGVPVTLRLGVRAIPFAAHAWVELEGNPVNETRDVLKEFEPIFQLS